MAATKLDSPTLSRGSLCRPDLIASWAEKVGASALSMAMTWSPLLSANRSNGGRTSGCGPIRPGGWMRSRPAQGSSSLPACGAAVCLLPSPGRRGTTSR